jgi:glutamate racemase
MTSDESESSTRGTSRASQSGTFARDFSASRRELPIGVFDSGIGGLTVLRALRQHLPYERFTYLGDTARLPYGTKSRDSVLRYSIQATEFLVQRGIKYLVIACNTASSVAVEHLRERFAPIPVIGVIEPGSVAGCAASRSGNIAVIATEGTVQGGAYQRAIAHIRPDAVVIAKACSLFVALAEEGWTEGPIAEAVAHRYLDALFRDHPSADTLLLGCTHFPLLFNALRTIVAPHIEIVDSAQTTAVALAKDLAERALARLPTPSPAPLQLLATDGPQRFAKVGCRFLGEEFAPEEVELVDLGLVQGGSAPLSSG